VPKSEQVIANMLNAPHLLGYGCFWATGLNSYERNVRLALGLQARSGCRASCT
jgi:nitroreductase